MPPSENDEKHPERQSPPLHIFVNRRKFGEADGVSPEMTGAQVAALVDVPSANAVVRIDSGPDKRVIDVNETIHVEMGQQFLVTRKVVEGGHDRAHSA